MNVKLTATQTTILKSAATRPDGNIEPLPTNLRGGAKTAVIDGLLARDLIAKFQHPDHVEYYLTDVDGHQPKTLSILWFKKNELPWNWDEQRDLFGDFDGQ